MSRRAFLPFRRILFFLLLAPILLWAASPASVSAHAQLLRTNPVAGALLDSAPTEIQIFLSENVSLDFSTVQLYDRARKEIATGTLSSVNADQTSILAPIAGPLQPGTYTVVWRALSSTDGHLTAGTFAFRVKGGSDNSEPIVPNAPAGGPVTPSGTGFDNADPFRWLVRVLSLAMSILLLGGSVFTVLVIEPTAVQTTGGKPEARVAPIASRRFAMLGTFAALSLLLLLLSDLALQVSSVNGTSFFGSFGSIDSAALIIQTTRYGFAWMLKLVAAVVLLSLMFIAWQVQRRNASWVWEISLAASSLLFLAESLASHGAAVSDAGSAGNLPLPIISDWLHLVTVGTWIGGVLYIALALYPAFRKAGLSGEERRAFLGRSIPRFTRLAITSVIIVGITGTYNLLIHSNDLGAILGSAYGQLLALKIAAYLVIVAIGAINVRRLTPLLLRSAGRNTKLESPDPRPDNSPSPVEGLQRNVRIEIAVGAIALICAGGLTLLPPPGGANSAALAASTTPITITEAPTALPTPGPATAGDVVAGYAFKLTTRPSADGDRLTLDLSRSDPASLPLTDVAKVLFKITPQDVNAGSTSYQASPVGSPGADKQSWQATQSFLTLAGGYQVTVTVQRTQSPDVKAAFRLDLSEAGGLAAAPADVIDVLLSTDPAEPVSGTVKLSITLVDGARKPVDGAKVTVDPSVPASAYALPPVVAPPVAGRPGTYASQVQMNLGGSWLLAFIIERDGKQPVKADASLEVIDPNATPAAQPSP